MHMNQLKIALVAAIAILAGIALRQPAAANTRFRAVAMIAPASFWLSSSGEPTPIAAHIHLQFTNPPRFVPQSMMLTL
jgi:hypothetical protein